MKTDQIGDARGGDRPQVHSALDREKPGTGIAVLTQHLLPPSDGARYRQATLALGANGDLTLTAHEMGGSLEAAWGADDDERTLTIPREAVARLAFALLREQLRGHPDALYQLSAFCEDHGLAHTLASWT